MRKLEFTNTKALVLTISMSLFLFAFYISVLPDNTSLFPWLMVAAVLAFDIYWLSDFIRQLGNNEDKALSKENIEAALTQRLGKLASNLFKASMTTLVYTCLSAKQVNSHTKCKESFSYHQSSNAKDIFWVVAMAQLPTLPLFHFLIEQETTAVVAWLITALTIWSVIHYFAQINAIKLNPLYLRNSKLHYHYGLSWQTEIPLQNITEARVATMADKFDPSSHFISPLGSSKNVILHFAQPVTFVNQYGLSKSRKKAVLSVDEPSRFLAALNM